MNSIELAKQIDGWLTQSQMEFLYKHTMNIRYFKTSLIVEIGTFRGKSTMLLASANPNSLVITIDPCDFPFTEETDRAMGFKLFNAPVDQRVLDLGNVIQIIGKSEEVVKTFCNQIDFLFIDGLHEQTDRDIKDWLPKVRKGGIIAFHDYDEGHPEVLNPVNELVASGVAKMLEVGEWICAVKKL